MKVLTVVGARPQFVKAGVVGRIIRSTPGLVDVLVHTGQHYDDNMSKVFFDELQIPRPDYHLGIGSGLHGQQTGRMLEAIEQVILKEEPDRVLVYGDTNSTLAGALAAAKLHRPVDHVEAGLRSFNRRMPEELNRVAADHLCDLLFAPTDAAVSNLEREGLPSDRIEKVGDVMYDAALLYAEQAERSSDTLERLALRSGDYLLATVHRAENTDDPSRLRAIFEGLARISGDLPVVLPLHPRTHSVLDRLGWADALPTTLRLIDPVGYVEMVLLERHAKLIVTDSGGVQKEAYFHSVPCVTLRHETEWVELVEAGWNRLVPPVDASLVEEGIRNTLKGARPSGSRGLYGSGDAGERIVRKLAGKGP